MTPYLKGDTLKTKTSFLVSMLDFGGVDGFRWIHLVIR